MHKGHNIKLNKIGLASCSLLLLIAAMVITPSARMAYAEEPDGADAQTDAPATTALDNSSYKTSSVTIGFTPTKAETTLSPIDASGERGKINVKVNINLQNSDGYKIYVGSNSDQLKNGNDTIEPLTSETTYNDIPANHWGFSIQEGETAKDSYKAIPTTLRGTPEITSKSEEKNIKNKDFTYTLSFAANIGTDKPAGTYSNEVTVSVVSDPRELTLMTIDTMQEMTNPICSASKLGDEKQLKDERDGKYYWVTKLRDNNCWMTQNLDLDIGTASAASNTAPGSASWPAASLSDYDTAPSLTITNTAGYAGSATISTGTPYTRSWSLGDYRMKSDNATLANGNDCGFPKNLASQCTGAFEPYTTPTSANGDVNAHYILGNHYQWVVATAGTTDGTKSICPKGWKLPTSNSTTASGSFGKLITPGADNITTVKALSEDPYYFVRGGFVTQDANSLFYVAGSNGYYWSSIHSGDDVYYLSFSNDYGINPSNGPTSQAYGISVRCLAR